MSLRPITLITLGALLTIGSGPTASIAQAPVQAAIPSLRYEQASGCAGLFLYTWNTERSEVMTIRADRATVPLPDGATTVDIAKVPGVAVRVELTDRPRESLPFCSDDNPQGGVTPIIWTAVSGTVKFILKRRPSAAFAPISVQVENLVLRSPTGTEVKQRRDIQFTAAVGDIDK